MAAWNPKANEIFLQAVEISSPEDRQTYIEDACHGDDPLRGVVEALIAAGEQAGTFLESPHPDLTAAFDPPELNDRSGSTIGPYKLLQQLGEGGMGIVYMAEQSKPIQRIVALKIIKPGMDTRQVIARFEAERQALSMMDHPNIARVLDAGTTDNGRPYFVMELVKGVPITKYCDEKHLPLRERLELFVEVCQAVQHAHQKGIIHRDLKPSNVMVAEYDDHAVPKVIDFGVAKATAQKLTERTMFTEFGQVLGTMQYMSPEQAKLNQLDVDTRSDIYSLGVLLYELLTGTTPIEWKRLKETALDEMLRIIREEEPPKPSTRLTSNDTLPSIAANRHTEPSRLAKDLRGELDWVVMKCLEKDRNRRYETANGLARDIERHLHDEPVQACPPSASYRLKKFVRRNKIAAAFILLLIAAIAALTISNVQTRKSERRATTENAKAQAVSELMQRMLRSANPDEAKNSEYTVRQLLDDFSAGLGAELADQPEVEAEIRTTIGQAYWRLGAPDTAEPHLSRALELRRRQFGPDHDIVAESQVDRAWCFSEQLRIPEAEEAAREALRIYRAHGTAGLPLIRAQAVLQRVLVNSKRSDAADAIAKDALALAQTSGAEYPELATILHTWAETQIERGQFAEAEQTARQAVELHHRLHGHDHPETGWGLQMLGRTLICQRKFPEAEAALREALAIFRLHYQDTHHSLNASNGYLRQVLESQGDRAGLEVLAREERESDSISLNSEMDISLRLADFYIRVGHGLTAQSKRSEAFDEVEARLKTQLEAIEAISPNSIRWREERGHKLRIWASGLPWKGDYQASAERAFQQSIITFEKLAEESPGLIQHWHYLADSYRSLGDLYDQTSQTDKAEAAFRTAVELFDEHPNSTPDNSDERATGYFALANFLARSERLTEAVPIKQRGCDVLEAALKLRTPNAADYNNLAWRLATSPVERFRIPERAVQLAQQAIELAPNDGPILNTLGVAQYRVGKWQPSIESLGKSMELRAGGDSFDWFFLAMAHWQLGHKDEARQWYDKSVTWMEKHQPTNGDLQRFRTEAEQLLGISPEVSQAEPPPAVTTTFESLPIE